MFIYLINYVYIFNKIIKCNKSATYRNQYVYVWLLSFLQKGRNRKDYRPLTLGNPLN